jgi:hypothetical protein
VVELHSPTWLVPIQAHVLHILPTPAGPDQVGSVTTLALSDFKLHAEKK